MTEKLIILNGPNLNLLGEREPEIYGTTTLAAIEDNCQKLAGELGLELDFLQSNFEGELVTWIQEARKSTDGLIINPAGYSFHSVPILDALKLYQKPIIEVHLSNIHARDEHHRNSILSSVASGVICGLGAYGYELAISSIKEILGSAKNNKSNI
ncbi:type II 3-dehydroquinate dehydratase [Sneathiella limimaris]|uniref:type II 3-dehydroquinate dehydratase n=1 Tax=Sneathiella limimaris TaxID=1964213 RepID=UPI00146D6B7F|nr:type II 3-dehydroquinate dehydratase [Sneathiella limimaris]